MASVERISYNSELESWVDEHGQPVAGDALRMVDGTVVAIVGPPWDTLIANARHPAIERELRGAMQARCHTCSALVGVSALSQAAVGGIPPALVLCMHCADKLEEIYKQKIREGKIK